MYYANRSIRQVIKNLEKDYGDNVKALFELDEDELVQIYIERTDNFNEFIEKLSDDSKVELEDKTTALENFIAIHVMEIRFLYDEAIDAKGYSIDEVPTRFEDAYNELMGKKILSYESISGDEQYVLESVLKSLEDICKNETDKRSNNFVLGLALKNACFRVHSMLKSIDDKKSFKEPIPPFARSIMCYAKDVKVLNEARKPLYDIIYESMCVVTEKEYSNEYYYRYKLAAGRVLHALMEEIVCEKHGYDNEIDDILDILDSIEYYNFSKDDLEVLEMKIFETLDVLGYGNNNDIQLEKFHREKSKKKLENKKIKLNEGGNPMIKKKINTKNGKIIVHYMNQFFAGKGGEDMADYKIEIIDGVAGPGSGIQGSIGNTGKIIKTIICGDNYFLEHEEECLSFIRNIFEEIKPDLLIAGPAFNAGRYGMACGRISKFAYEMGISAISGLYKENPGYERFKDFMHVVHTGNSAVSMREAIPEIGKKVKEVLKCKV